MNREHGFVEKEFRNLKAEGIERSWVAGASAAAIGWIPYYGSAEALGDSPLRGKYEKEQAVKLLFASGNPEPQASFPGDARFADRLGLGDFRAAIALRRPRLALNAQRQPLAVRVGVLRRMGNTPIRFPGNKFEVQAPGRGSGTASYLEPADVRFSVDGVEIRYEYKFKLGWTTDLATALLLTRKLAPFAWIEMKYKIRCSGLANLELRSSVVPSVHLYEEDMGTSGQPGYWLQAGKMEMEKISFQEFNAFVDTDYREKGPGGYPLIATPRCFVEKALER